MISVSGVGEYICAHYVLKAHAGVYDLYKNTYYEKYKGKIGITLNSGFLIGDENAINRGMEFTLGWFAHPIFSETGGYPQVMIDQIKRNSINEKRSQSRLPKMSEKTKAFIKGSADFLGLNYYTSRLVKELNKPVGINPSWDRDCQIGLSIDKNWPKSKSYWLYSVPEGLGGILRWIRDNYNNTEVLITENGWSDGGELNDIGRANYLKDHLTEVLKAVTVDNCNVSGYTTWSIIDNFEWMMGFSYVLKLKKF